MQNLNILDQYMLSSYVHSQHRVAIVGNGGLVATDLENISKCNVVIRFNNYLERGDINTPRCNILFSAFGVHSNGASPRDVVIGVPFPYQAEEVEKKIVSWYPRSNYWMVNPYENLKMNRELGFKGDGTGLQIPSLGFTALWHLRNWQAVFYVTGFNWYSNPLKNTIQDHPVGNRNYPKHWSHNYHAELSWITRNLAPKNNFIFSDESQQIIDHFCKCA